MEIHRPRTLGWRRAACLLYGDWGTSKAYVIGLAFAVMGFASLPIVLAVCALSLIVGLNYIIICRCFPAGGGVYSAARPHGRLLAVVGALMLIADFTVTAALSTWAALSYLNVPAEWIPAAAIAVIILFGALNYYGPHHSGTLAVVLAIPVVSSVVGIIALSIPHLSFRGLELPHASFYPNWVAFTGVILALSGVEAIATLTGVLKADKGSPPDSPRVVKNATKAIVPVALEVSVGTALLAWAVLSLPHELKDQMLERRDDILRFAAEHYATAAFGPAGGKIFGLFVGIAFALLLLSAVNTVVAALIGLMFRMSGDNEMPRSFTRLNRHGVPTIPLAVSVVLPVLVLLIAPGLEALAGLYAIGVVGAIAVDLGSTAFNRALPIGWPSRIVMGATFALLCCVWLTLAHTKPDALFFVTCVMILGLALRAWSQKHKGITTVTVPQKVAAMVESVELEKLKPGSLEGGKILLCLRGVTPVLKFAVETAKLRGAALYILYVREVAVAFGASAEGAKARWQDDPEAALIMKTARTVGEEAGVNVVPVYAVAESAGAAIVDVAATLGVDELFLGASGHSALAHLLHGSVVQQVVKNLPDEIGLVIRG
ncbi:MAG: amino acid permease [Chthoniobacterales bacterium]|nr:amino acid permease [Chthoniobacterales bacterium]